MARSACRRNSCPKISSNNRARPCFDPEVPGYIKGILVALANTFLVALFIGFAIERHDVVEAVFVISLMGFIPGVIVGGLLGHYAETSQRSDRRVVLLGMIAIACATVAFLGVIFGLHMLVVVSCIPTAAGCSILERWTRAHRDDVPIARVA